MGFFSGNIIQAICWTLLHSLWQGLLLAVVTGVVMVLSKKSGSALRYRLLSVIFVAFIVIVGITFSMQLRTTQPHTLAAPIMPVHDVLPLVITPGNNENYMPVTSDTNGMQSYIKSFVAYFNEHASLIVTIWFIVFMARCVKILSGLVYIQRIRHYKTSSAPENWEKRITELAASLQIKRHILLLQSAIIKVPVVVGFLKPTILIPIGLLNNLSQQEVESILIHELAHIRRKDYFFNLLQCFIDVLFFFNPAVLWISSLIRNERENCCDDIAISETKNKKQFIQALVSFHQYNSAPASYAMPFAARKNKLVNRVKRIVNNNNHTLNPVEKIVLLVCLLVFSVTFITVTNGQTSKPKKPAQSSGADSTAKSNSQPATATYATPGVKSSPKPKHADSTSAQEHPDENDDHNGPEGYIGGMQSLGYKNLTVDELVNLKRHGVDPEFIRGFVKAGYSKITLDQAIQLKNHGVDADFINSFKQAGFSSITLEEAIQLRNHGVSADYVNELKQAGVTGLTLDKVIEYRNRGMNADYIKSFHEAGYKDVTMEEALSLREHGVSIDYINELKQAGIKDLTLKQAEDYRSRGLNADFINSFRQAGYNVTPEEALSLREHGVSVDYINDLKQAGVKDITLKKAEDYRNHGLNGEFISSFRQAGYNVTPEEALQLRDHGVSVEYISDLKGAGVKDITLEKAIEYREHGVNGEFIKSFSQAGFGNITVEKAMELRDHGVNADFVRGIKEAGYKDITPEQAIQLRDHGISPEYIASMRTLGITDLTLDKAVQLRDHGITVDYINSFSKIGIKNLTLDKAIQLRDHGVTADFIERIRKKTGNDFTLDEYMKLKEVF